jgi:hypothetical protein
MRSALWRSRRRLTTPAGVLDLPRSILSRENCMSRNSGTGRKTGKTGRRGAGVPIRKGTKGVSKTGKPAARNTSRTDRKSSRPIHRKATTVQQQRPAAPDLQPIVLDSHLDSQIFQ